MYFTDSHIHSKCSPDAYNTMLEMVLASQKLGVDTLCFTDHVDLDDTLVGIPDPDCFSAREKMDKMYEDTLALAPKDMTIRLGIELGELNHDPERAKVIAASPELDFVLGSLHNLRGKPDFYNIEYKGKEHCRELFDEYMDELLETAALPCFDVMAHIGYPVRYSSRLGYELKIDLKTYGDKIEQILKTLIQNGKGIEINCAGFRNPGGGAIPLPDVLRLYRELGGEIITVGSDAHKTVQAGVGVKEGYEILRGLGYGYVTVFEKRKPQFLKIQFESEELIMIALGSDHGGFPLKKEIIKYLEEKGVAYKDFGTDSEESCDYPVYGEIVGKAVASGEYERGIIICGTGIGISIAANKVRGVRAALCHDCYSAEFTRRHNDANVLALGARVIGPGHALKIVDIFLNTEFEGGRHAKRVGLISEIEERSFKS